MNQMRTLLILLYLCSSIALSQEDYWNINPAGRINGGGTNAISVHGNVCLTGSGNLLTLLNISSLREPSIYSRLYFSDVIHEIKIIDSLAFIAAGYAGLVILDISDPAHPLEISSYMTTSKVTDIIIDEEVVFIASGHIYALNAHNPNALYLLGIYDRISTEKPFLVDDLLYATYDMYGLQRVNVSNPAEMYLERSYTLGGGTDTGRRVKDIAVIDEFAFLACFAHGFMSIALGSGSMLSRINTPGYSFAVETNDSIAFVSDNTGGLRIIDINDPFELREILSLDTLAIVTSSFLEGTTLFVCDHTYGINIYDVSELAYPTLLASFDLGGPPQSCTLFNDYFVMAECHSGIGIYDLRDTTELISRFAGDFKAYTVAVKDSLILFTKSKTHTASFITIDASDPADLIFLDSIPIGTGQNDIQIVDSFAIVTSNNGIYVIDLSTPHDLSATRLAVESGLSILDAVFQDSLAYITTIDYSYYNFYFGVYSVHDYSELE